jgi:hypothetical protein
MDSFYIVKEISPISDAQWLCNEMLCGVLVIFGIFLCEVEMILCNIFILIILKKNYSIKK